MLTNHYQIEYLDKNGEKNIHDFYTKDDFSDAVNNFKKANPDLKFLNLSVIVEPHHKKILSEILNAHGFGL